MLPCILITCNLGSSQKTGPNHFYTTSQDEIGTTILGQVGKDGYMSQGIAGHVYTGKNVSANVKTESFLL